MEMAMEAKAMHIHDAARWAERKDCVIRVDYDGNLDYFEAAVDMKTNRVLCMGWGDKARNFKRDNPDLWVRVYTISEVLDGISEEAGERMNPERDYRCEAWAH